MTETKNVISAVAAEDGEHLNTDHNADAEHPLSPGSNADSGYIKSKPALHNKRFADRS